MTGQRRGGGETVGTGADDNCVHVVNPTNWQLEFDNLGGNRAWFNGQQHEVTTEICSVENLLVGEPPLVERVKNEGLRGA